MTQAWDFIDADVLWQVRDRVRSRKIVDLELSPRFLNPLLNNQILTIDDLVSCSEGQLLRIPNFGRKALAAIKDVLADDGLKLSDRYSE